MGDQTPFLGFRHALVVLGALPAVSPRRAVRGLAAIAGLAEHEALAIMEAAPVRLYGGMPLAEAARWQLRLQAAGVACTVQAETPQMPVAVHAP